MRRAISIVLAFALIAGGTAFTFIRHGYAPRIGSMGLFMIAVGIAWALAEFKGD